jgi:hypothetical protein
MTKLLIRVFEVDATGKEHLLTEFNDSEIAQIALSLRQDSSGATLRRLIQSTMRLPFRLMGKLLLLLGRIKLYP